MLEITFGLFSPSIFTNFLYAQEKEKKEEKPKIIFKKSSLPDSLQYRIRESDTTYQKVVFKKSALMKAEEIELLSSKQFKWQGETRLIGKKGMKLKNAMGQNLEAIAMVDKAYQKNSTGKTLMVIGGIVMVAGFLIPVQVAETETTIWYWFPGVTLGGIIGGIGLSQQSSLTKDLQTATKVYNTSLVKESQPE